MILYCRSTAAGHLKQNTTHGSRICNKAAAATDAAVLSVLLLSLLLPAAAHRKVAAIDASADYEAL